VDRRQQAGVLGAPEVRAVDRDQDVGLGLVALAAQTLVELRSLATEQRQVIAGRGREVAERLLLAIVRTSRVDDDVVVRRVARGEHHADEGPDDHNGAERHDQDQLATSAHGLGHPNRAFRAVADARRR
jgi:hypothetical protein